MFLLASYLLRLLSAAVALHPRLCSATDGASAS